MKNQQALVYALKSEELGFCGMLMDTQALLNLARKRDPWHISYLDVVPEGEGWTYLLVEIR